MCLFLYGPFCHGALKPNCLHCLQHVFSEHRLNLYYPIFVFTIQIASTQHVFQLTAKCLTCFECANTTQPADCTTTKQCGIHEVCLHLTYRHTCWNDVQCPIKRKNLRYTITYNVILANQRTEPIEYHWLRALAMFDVASFAAICWASDVISSFFDSFT